MARVTELRNGLADVVETAAPDLARGRAWGSVNPPAFVVNPANPFAGYQQAMGGETSGRYRFEVVFLFGAVADQAAQEKLDELVSPDGPVVPALYDADLPEAEVVSVTGQQYGQFRHGDALYPGASLLVEMEA